MAGKHFLIMLATCLVALVAQIQSNPLETEVSSDLVNEKPRGLSKGSINDRKCSLLKNRYMSDVSLVVREHNGLEETNEIIPGHKFILKVSSTAFERAFKDKTKSESSFTVDQMSTETFEILLKFIYCGKTELTEDRLLDVFLASQVYELLELTDHVAERLAKTITRENVFEIEEKVRSYPHPIVSEAISEVVQSLPTEAFNHDLAEKLRKNSVELILKQDTLQIAELDLFDFLLGWTRVQAYRQGHNQGNSATGHVLRQTMGDLLHLIRIPALDSKAFLQRIASFELFNDQEVKDILYHQLLDAKPVNGIVWKFKLEKRSCGQTIDQQYDQ